MHMKKLKSIFMQKMSFACQRKFII